LGSRKIWSVRKIKKLEFERTKLNNIEKRIKNTINSCWLKAFSVYFELIPRFIYIWIGVAWLVRIRRRMHR
jgi:hypothetical protein